MLTTIRRVGLAVLVAAAGSTAHAADAYAVDPVHSSVSFKISHVGISYIHGRFDDFGGKINMDPKNLPASSVDFHIKATSIDTSVPDRDKHLRSADFFDVEKFPEISFKSDSVKTAGKDRYDVTGTLTIHGVSKKVTLPVSYLGTAKDPWGGTRAGFETSTTLNRKDFGIVWNKALDNGGVMLGDDVKVDINLETKLDVPAAEKKGK